MRVRSSFLAVAAVGLALAACSVISLHAEEYKYPKAAPVLGLTIPEDWDVTEQTGPAVLLLCTPPDEASYTVSMMSLPAVGNPDDVAQMLARITKAGAQGAGMTEIVVSKGTEETVGKSPRRFLKVAATGKHNNEPSAFVYYAFRLPTTGRTYAVGVAGAQAMIDAHRADFEAVVNSLTMLAPSKAVVDKPLSANSSTSPSPSAASEDGPRVELRPSP